MSKPTRSDVVTGTMLFMVGGYAMLLMIVVSGCVRSVSPSPAAVTAIGSDDHQLKAEHVAGGSQAERLATADGADLVLLFGGETRGDLRPCGCEDRPAGGLARVASHVQAVRAAGDPVLVLRSGAVFSDVQTLDGQFPSETTETNVWMSEALAELPRAHPAPASGAGRASEVLVSTRVPSECFLRTIYVVGDTS